jgi:NADPH-dependent 2,4-dienoyl-CoA reductase/sulfur reductase-like enzyme
LGVDLLEFFRGRRPFGQLLRFARQLPNHSRYKAALLDNEDYARAVLATGAKPASPTMEGFTPTVAAIKDLTDWVKALYSLGFATAGQTPPQLPDTPRPRTAFDRVRKSDAHMRHRQRVKIMIGG